MKTEAKTGVMLPQAKEHLEPPETGRDKDFPRSLQRKCDPADP